MSGRPHVHACFCLLVCWAVLARGPAASAGSNAIIGCEVTAPWSAFWIAPAGPMEPARTLMLGGISPGLTRTDLDRLDAYVSTADIPSLAMDALLPTGADACLVADPAICPACWPLRRTTTRSLPAGRLRAEWFAADPGAIAGHSFARGKPAVPPQLPPEDPSAAAGRADLLALQVTALQAPAPQVTERPLGDGPRVHEEGFDRALRDPLVQVLLTLRHWFRWIAAALGL